LYPSVFKANTTLNDIYYHSLKYVSESDILGLNCKISDIKDLVSFEKEMFENSRYSYRIKNSYYLCHYHHFEIHAWNIINGVHVNYMAISVYLHVEINEWSF